MDENPFEVATRPLPYGRRIEFEIEADGERYRYKTRVRSFTYHRDMNVWCSVSIKKTRHLWWRIWLPVWEVEEYGYICPDDTNLRDSLVTAGARLGILPTDLLLNRCLSDIRRRIGEIRDEAFQKRGALEASIRRVA